MAFDFMDLFPDSPAAVTASQGARDILENQYKQSMGALDMENAMMKSVDAKKKFELQRSQEPLAKTVEALKLIQGLNMTSLPPVQDFQISDPQALNDYLIQQAGSGNLKTDFEVDLEKAKAQERVGLARTQITQSGQNERQDEKIEHDEREVDEKAADEKAKALLPKDFMGRPKAKHLMTPKDIEILKLGFSGLEAQHPQAKATRAVKAMFPEYLSAAPALKQKESVLDTEARLRQKAAPAGPKDGDRKPHPSIPGVMMVRKNGAWYPEKPGG